ncbi:ThuA domain-containing protein [Poriferisphaera sp. WC338]|uniref:ThuA domain-containing protein n=1 Tax=Poriferisphaera sp. WC338 TaxID=3425129 RepID=UPI003D81A6B5
MSNSPLRVTVWHEHVHEQTSKVVKDLYPDGMHGAMKAGIEEYLGQTVTVQTALLEQPEHGLTDEVLANTDVLTWWGHAAHDKVDDEIVNKVHQRVLEGMGIVILHSGHYSKIFQKLMGTTCSLRWREAGEKERLWVMKPGHPITDGIDGEFFEIKDTEMYGEFFDIPDPDETVLISWFEGGEIFRSCCTWDRGKGKVVYFRPGHETFPIYYQKEVRQVLANCVAYAAPKSSAPVRLTADQIRPSLETIEGDHQADESLHEHQYKEAGK